MDRRRFLKGLVGGTVLAPVALKLLPVVNASEQFSFGMAAVKAEGTAIAFDSVTGAQFAGAIWPGVKDWWDKHYAECPPEYKDLFEGDK